MHGPSLPSDLQKEEKFLKLSTFNVKNIETNKQYLHQLMRTSNVIGLQETWLFNFQLKQLNTLHKAFEGYGKAVDDDDPLSPTQKPIFQYRNTYIPAKVGKV